MEKPPFKNINEETYTNRELWLIINGNMEKLESIIDRFDRFEEKLDKTLEGKANVWVEKAFTWLLYTVGGIVVTALMYLIIIKK